MKNPGSLIGAGGGAVERALRRAGFAAVLAGRSPSFSELAAEAGISEEATREVLAELVMAGRATMTADGCLDGIAGLTLRPTRHAIEWAGSVSPSGKPTVSVGNALGPGGRRATWCAFDAVAIPAALGRTATAVTTCGGCGADLRVPLDAGVPAGDAWGWLPPTDCQHVLRDFCAAADLYCDRAHLDAWRAAAGASPGQPHPVAALADLGREAWADCLPTVSP